MITDKLRSYCASKRDIMPSIEHRSHKGLNNREENAHLPTRRRERIMKRFKSPRQVKRFNQTQLSPKERIVEQVRQHPQWVEEVQQRQSRDYSQKR